jgi:hypothetical protein
MKKAMLVLFVVAMSLAVQGCFLCPEKIDGDRLAEVNAQWWKIYDSQRCPTAAEIAEYDALDDAGKKEWRKARKPILKALLPAKLDAVKDLKKAIDAEAEAAK